MPVSGQCAICFARGDVDALVSAAIGLDTAAPSLTWLLQSDDANCDVHIAHVAQLRAASVAILVNTTAGAEAARLFELGIVRAQRAGVLDGVLQPRWKGNCSPDHSNHDRFSPLQPRDMGRCLWTACPPVWVHACVRACVSECMRVPLSLCPSLSLSLDTLRIRFYCTQCRMAAAVWIFGEPAQLAVGKGCHAHP